LHLCRKASSLFVNGSYVPVVIIILSFGCIMGVDLEMPL
jgi:hypothetical protein